MYNLVKSLSRSRTVSQLLKAKQMRNFAFIATKPKVLVTLSKIPGEGINRLKEECDVDVYETDLGIPRDELIKRISGVDGLYCTLMDKIDKKVIKAAGDQLKVISTISTGYDHIDLEECRKRGIQVSHTPSANGNSVAEWTIMLMLCAGRRFLEAASATKNGEWTVQWRPEWLIGKGLENTVVGIVGMGRIGQRILQRVLPFGVKKVLYYDIHHPIMSAEEMGAIYADFRDLISESDFIVSMINLTEETRNLFNKDVFDLMKPTAVFVNTSRGEVVDQRDLYNALKYKIRAAALDVTVPEPLPAHHILNSLPNLIITPHIACAEKHAFIKMADLTAENVLLGVKRQPLKTLVPELR